MGWCEILYGGNCGGCFGCWGKGSGLDVMNEEKLKEICKVLLMGLGFCDDDM